MDALFDYQPPKNVPHVVRGAITGRVWYEDTDPIACHAWIDANPKATWVVVERRDERSTLDQYIHAGMLRNYPNEPRRRTNRTQLALEI